MSMDHTLPSSLVMQPVKLAAFAGSDRNRGVNEVDATKATTSIRASVG